MTIEELLNKLIEKGWKPFGNHKGKYGYDNLEINNTKKKMYMSFFTGTSGRYVESHGLREICSKESGLWQFVCENKFVKTKDKKVRYMYEDLERTQNYFSWYGYEYRLIECALKDESDLEKFLLDNIEI